MKNTKQHFFLKGAIGLASTLYSALKLLPVHEKVVLISRMNRTTSVDFELLEREIKHKYPGVKVVILNHRMKSRFSHIFDVLDEMYHLATAQAAIIDSYVIAVSLFNHREKMIIVQIWHALGAIKKFGYATVDKPAGNTRDIAKVMRMHKNYTFVTCGSAAMAPAFSECFGLGSQEGQIRPIGMPRVDYLLSEEARVKAQTNMKMLFPKLAGGGSSCRKVILYAPTFRKKGKISPQKLIDSIDFDKYALIIKQHTLDKTKLAQNENVRVIEDEICSLDLLNSVDFVVTDYSAIAFEAAVLEKPLFFWAYDYEKYAKSCGFALDYRKEMPGVVSGEARKIMRAIDDFEDGEIQKIRKFKDKYISVQDGTSTEKIVELLCLEN